MRPPLPLRQAPHFPVTSGVGLLAIVVTAGWWTGRDITAFFMDVRAWHGEPWRLVSSALPHVNFIHLALNLSGLWVLGTALESAYGWWRTWLLYVLLAVVSSAAEYAVFVGGVGLSGVLYGLCAFLGVVGRRDPRLQDVVDRATIQLFVGWFVLCVVLTYTGVWEVGNVAHAAGAIAGLLLGGLVSARRRTVRVIWAGAVALLVVASVAGASFARPYVNFATSQRGLDLAWLAYEALDEGDPARAEELYVQALRMNPQEASWWYNLAHARMRQRKYAEAIDACGHALAIPRIDPSFRKDIVGLRDHLTAQSAARATRGK